MQHSTSSQQRRSFPFGALLAGVGGALLALLLFWLLGGGFQAPAPVAPPVASPLGSQDLLELQNATNKGLQAEIDRLKALLAGDVCATAPIPLGKLPVQPAAPRQGGSGQGTSPSVGTPPPVTGTTPDAGQGASPPSSPNDAGQGQPPVPRHNATLVPTAPPFVEPATVADLLAQATVMVFYHSEQGFGFGTGFFIAPGVVVTNKHVIAANTDGKVFVSNPTLGGVVSATVQAVSSDGPRDYAVLQVDGARAREIRPLTFSTQVARTDRVSAWGYPGLLVETDPQFVALYKGDATAAPEVTYTEGVVSVVMQTAIPSVIHTAELSHGNSGGPLVNAEGQVVAINTLIRFNDESNRQTSISFVSADLVKFLQEKNVAVTMAGKK